MIRNIRIVLDATPPEEYHGPTMTSYGPRIATNRVEETFSTAEHLHARGTIGQPIVLRLSFE